MTDKKIADDMINLIVTALKAALEDNTLDGFGSGIATSEYEGTDKTTGEPIEIKLKVEAFAKTMKG